MLALLVGSTTAHQCPLHDVKPGTVSPVIDSLQCYNDDSTYVQCTWEEDPHVHSLAAGNGTSRLYYREQTDDKDTLCALLGPGVGLSNGKISYSCRYNTGRFTPNTNHTVYFKVPCESGLKPFSVAQQGKVLAPFDLTEKRSDYGGHVLSWRSPYPASSNITRTLTYQLQYSMYGQDWTTVDNISASEYMIDKKMLSLGHLYQARVRARGAIGLWSNWSQPVSWRIHNDGVFNLQCVIEGDTNVMCSWQMRTEISHFMSYHLWCSHHDTQDSKPSECCGTPLLKSRGSEVSEFNCFIKTSDPYLLTVELRPVYHSRKFQPTKNIQLPQPDPVHVKEADGVFSLSWSTPAAYKPETFFIQLKISTNETSVLYNLTGNAGFEISSTSLHPSTQYKAQIRFLLRASSQRKGLPSEWSQLQVFTTGPASWSITTIIYIFVSVIVAVIFIGVYNALPVCHRRIKLWNGSIPSPINSRVMEEIIKKSSPGWPYLQSEKEKTSVCVMQTTDNISICKSSISGEPLLHKENVSSDAKAVKKGWSDGSVHFSSYVGEGIYQDNSGMSFSGPYILCCEESCDQDETFDTSSHTCHKCLSGTSENSGPTNGGYVVTPPMLVTQNPTPVNSSSFNPSDGPPAYTSKLDQGNIVHLHPSGYFMMPCVGVSQLEPRGYVALSPPGTL